LFPAAKDSEDLEVNFNAGADSEILMSGQFIPLSHVSDFLSSDGKAQEFVGKSLIY
jgi:hypothetical protein